MTEAISQKYLGLDNWPAQRAVEAMYDGQAEAVSAIRPALDAIANAAEAPAINLGDTGRLIYVGAGTSGRLAVQDGSELGPTFGWPFERLEFCMAGGEKAFLQSQEGAEDSSEDGQKIIQDIKAGSGDVVICVAASGRTPFTLGALKEAKDRGAMTVGISNNPDVPILTVAAHPILVETGPEIIAGSTRMNAGTAQKVVLNMLSTAIMIKLGRVYDGFMVDMVVSNAKLENRAAHMVSQISNCSVEKARAALAETNNHIKAAVLVCMGETVTRSQDILAQASGNLREALKLFGQGGRNNEHD